MINRYDHRQSFLTYERNTLPHNINNKRLDRIKIFLKHFGAIQDTAKTKIVLIPEGPFRVKGDKC